MRRRLLIIVTLGFLAGIPGLFFVMGLAKPPAAEILRQARAELKKRQFAVAEKLSSSVTSEDPLYTDAMLIAGESATKLDHLEDAVRYYRCIPIDESEKAVLAQFSLANVLIHTGDVSSALAAFQRVLTFEPMDVATHSRVAFLYAASARRWESRPHLELILKSGGATVDELALLADLERPVDEAEYLKKCKLAVPQDTNVRLGLASIAAQNGDPASAVLELQKITHQQPDLWAAQGLLGELLASEHSRRFESWHAELSGDADQWPDIWYARGVRSQLLENHEIAARCFWEVLRISPIHRRANYQLGRVLAELRDPNADGFAEQSRRLFSLTTLLQHAIGSEGRNEVVVHDIVDSLDQMGRVWETCAWAQLARQNFPDSEWPSAYLDRLAPLLNGQLPMVLPEKNLALTCDLSGLPDFSHLREPEMEIASPPPEADVISEIDFREESSVGLNFTYDNAGDETTKGQRMQEQTGGGVTVVDVDQDGWPDVYLVQGAEWRTAQTVPMPSPTKIDGIFRNRFGHHFDEITPLTGVVETEFGQSCSCGDLNEDGFPDLYIANIGQNTLFLSNGDGTFYKVDSPQSESIRWTSSSAIVDLNADGFADLIDVNYVAGPDVFFRICSGRACSPSAFTGVVDQVHLSQGNGQFVTISASTPAAESKGLGLVVYQDAEKPLPFVFISNDQTPKFLLTLSRDEASGWTLNDSAFQTGLAYSGDGLLTAAMGIAADDVDNNGLIDFFVTNFQDEANTLYLQSPGGSFYDASRSAGLDAAGVPYVGWGTQFLDADLDGNPDLVVANGHVEDYRDENGEYHMRPQFFRNLGGTQFQEMMTDRSSGFWSKKFLGRGLARLDWNQDGLMDFAVSNIQAPISLVTNATQNAGHFVNVKLHATRTSRNAFFTRVRVQTEKAGWTRQLCAGDGYHAGNERTLQFGLGRESVIKSIHISWPSGAESLIENPPSDVTVEVVEVHSTGLVWKGQRPSSFQIKSTPPTHSGLSNPPGDTNR